MPSFPQKNPPPKWAIITPAEEARIRAAVRARPPAERAALEAFLWIRRNIKTDPTYREIAEVANRDKMSTGAAMRSLEAAGLLIRINGGDHV